MSKKILVLSLRKRSGGCPLYSREIMKHFPPESYDVAVAKGSLLDFPHDNQIEVATYGGAIDFAIGLLTRVPRIIFKFWPKIRDDYHTLYIPYDAYWNVFFVIMFKLLNKRVVYTVHDAKRHSGEQSIFIQTLYNFMRRRADHFIFLTKDQQQVLYDYLHLETPSVVIPHGIFDMKGIRLRKKENGRNLLFLGRIVKYKGLDILLEAASEITDHFDKIVVAGQPNYTINQIDHPKFEYHLKFLDDDEIVELLNKTDILILPYLEASQSGVVTLGINSEIPMICSRVNGLSEQLEDEECIYVPPNDKEALKSSIIRLTNEPVLRRQFKQALSQKKKSLQWKQIAEQVLDILNVKAPVKKEALI